jgi:hypothetical protein
MPFNGAFACTAFAPFTPAVSTCFFAAINVTQCKQIIAA